MDEYAKSTGQTFDFGGGFQGAGAENMQSTNTQTSESESEPAGPTFPVSTPTGGAGGGSSGGGSSGGGY